MSKPKVVIVGGGAAGLVAAISGARNGAHVTVLESGSRPGRKILASGNGRCNLSNLTVTPSAYSQPMFVSPVLEAYSCAQIQDFFSSLGLMMFSDDEGRIYPITNTASSVLEVLRLECGRLGIEQRFDFQVASVVQSADANTFELTSKDGATVRADAVIVATGGGRSVLQALGHRYVKCTPVLCPIRTEAEPIRGLSGVRVKCSASLISTCGNGQAQEPIAIERGELLFRDYGVSGIMIFDLSRYITRDCVISLDFFPDFDLLDLEQLLADRAKSLSWRSAETFFEGMLHERIAHAILRVARVKPKVSAGALPIKQLATTLKEFRLSVTGLGDAKQAQVMRGGASVTEFEAATLVSHIVPGLFAAGEVLDVDGRCGGYNLHWAWASGLVAGEQAAKFVFEQSRVAQ